MKKFLLWLAVFLGGIVAGFIIIKRNKLIWKKATETAELTDEIVLDRDKYYETVSQKANEIADLTVEETIEAFKKAFGVKS